jgi:hypothetical protein
MRAVAATIRRLMVARHGAHPAEPKGTCHVGEARSANCMLVRCVAVHWTVVGEGAVLKGIDVPIKSGPGRPAWGRDPSTAGDPGTGPAGVHGEQ